MLDFQWSANCLQPFIPPPIQRYYQLLQHGKLDCKLDMLVWLAQIVEEKCVFICLPSCLFACNDRDCALQFFVLCLPTVSTSRIVSFTSQFAFIRLFHIRFTQIDINNVV